MNGNHEKTAKPDPVQQDTPSHGPSSRDDPRSATKTHADPGIGNEGRNSTQSGQDDAARKAQREVLYDRFAEKTRALFESGQEKGRQAFDKAMDRAREQLAAAGEFTAEQGDAFKEYLKRDLEQTTQDMRSLGQEAEERLHPSRLGAGALSSLAKLLSVTGKTMDSLSRKAERTLSYRTGEVTAAGTLTCTGCGQKVQLRQTGHVPPCPSCHGTQFRKGY